MSNVIQAQGLTKSYGHFFALNNVSFELGAGRIMGLIGPNGAGKTTALRCLMGMTEYQGHLAVLDKNPQTNRTSLLHDIAYIADTAILPPWMTVAQLLDYTAGVHPKFNLTRANDFLASTEVKLNSQIKTLSKGMITQVHLALAISIDARLLVLDEPTIGLDILFRKRFYEQLINDYFDEGRTILITTHQVEEVEHLLTDLLFIRKGKVALNTEMAEIGKTFIELVVDQSKLEEARQLAPIHERSDLGSTVLIYENISADQLSMLGQTRTPSVADLFVAKMS